MISLLIRINTRCSGPSWLYSLFRSNLFYETSSFPFGFFYIPKFKAFFVRSKRFFSARNIAKSHCIQTRAFFFVVFFSFVLPYLSMKHQLLLGSWLLGFSASAGDFGFSAPPPVPRAPFTAAMRNSMACSNQAAVEELQKEWREEHALRLSVCQFHIQAF